MALKCGDGGICECLFVGTIVHVLKCPDGINYQDVIDYDELEVVTSVDDGNNTATQANSTTESPFSGVMHGDSDTTTWLLISACCLFVTAVVVMLLSLKILVSIII